MNAIVSLCHFCELHGPKILYCTQTLRPQEKTASEADAVDGLSKRLKSTNVGIGSGTGSGEPASTGNASLSSSTSSSHHLASRDPAKDYAKDVCEGCKSVKTGFVSHDDEAQLSYVSTQQPHVPQIFTRMRQACIRSLSCEVCPGREGPIFYGDDQNGSVLSHTFYVPDSQARGKQRLYSIVVFMMDRIYLLNSWPFLVPQLRTIIDMLQNKAEKVRKEEADKIPQGVNRMSATLGPNFLKTRGGNNKPARSLSELTGDKNIFKILHVAFVWTLKACGSRISETLLEGPPTEDSIIDMEKQEETEEGFIKIYTRKISMEAKPASSQADEGSSLSLHCDETSRKEPTAETTTNVPPVTAHEGKPIIKGLRHLRKVLGNDKFQMLAHHVVIGNQIIVCSSDQALTQSFFESVKILLPRGCCRIIYHSDKYEESWRCNFLGQNPDMVLPDHVVSSERFLLVEIIQHDDHNYNSVDSDMSETDEDFSCYEFRLVSPVCLPDRVPAVLSRMLLALRNENLTERVMEQCFVCLKEEWMNKVKVLFKFTKAGGGRSEDETHKLLQVVGAKEEDKPLLKFWMTGLSVQYRTHILASSKQR
ncbi:hypothetical protein BaRGS_00007781 [Batillaria attramentaria]|uniref:Folliculin n=1 Tax=Batillaria attramentaria TaxID=370345 RepID=A0ABD0LNU0_9CAEN